MGAALAFWYQELGNKRKVVSRGDEMKGSYLGPSFSENEIENTLKTLDAKYEKQNEENLINTIANELKNTLKLKSSSLVVDIGSNDGIFLKPLKKLGVKAIGVEPAKNIAKIANSKNLETLTEYFTQNTVNKIIKYIVGVTSLQ